ncbi:MAG: BMP family ABC transporter substrate-binding protein [Eubacteriales bacterium]|nr:BMP family ABC transporter substrate-binding protein [Eubacteriales bacterium]
MTSENYAKAVKMGKKEVALRTAKGEYPYLAVLDNIPEAANSVMEYPLGLVQIPTDQIAGTKTDGRSRAFAANFMPVLGENSEFAVKWAQLCESHLSEGIREPIKAYEYMNKFYVLEGNKRVSVLKFFGAVSIPGTVTRIVPSRTEKKENKIYYEFMDFYNLSEVNYVWFSQEGGFARLQRLVGKRPDEIWSEDDKLTFSSLFSRFSAVYKANGGDKLDITPGDAFLDFIEIYGYSELDDMTTAELKEKVTKSWKVFDTLADESSVEIQMKPSDMKKTLLQRLIPTSSPTLKIAFVHETAPEKSGWTYAHDLGRMHLEQEFKGQVETTPYHLESTDEKEQMRVIDRAVEDGNTIIFTTSPVMCHASIKAAIAYPNVKILNCSLLAGHGSIRTYSARMYEAKFLMGAIAGAMAENDRIGYMADYPIYGSVANVNAFALGAKLVNPRAKIYVEWTSKKYVDVYKGFWDNGVSYVSGRDIIIPDKSLGSRHFGVFRLDEESPHNLAMPIWHWGKFYEKMIRSILAGTWKSEETGKVKSVNYWWGMSSGVIDVICSHNLPVGTARLVSLLRKTICEESFNPFSGILYSQDGVIQEDEDTTLKPERIITMDWLAENIIGSIPKMADLEEKAKPVVLQQGVESAEE